jgi:hypothetical protein
VLWLGNQRCALMQELRGAEQNDVCGPRWRITQ